MSNAMFEPRNNEERMAQRNLILRSPAGSNLYGTATPESDRDEVGIFIPDPEYVLGLKVCEQVEHKTNSSASGRRNDWVKKLRESLKGK